MTELKKVEETSPITTKELNDIGDPTIDRPLSINEVKGAVPARFTKMIDRDFVDHLNQISKDPMEAAYIKDNFMTFGSILEDGRYSVQDYTNAIKYNSYLMLNHTKASAYSKTFPERYKRLVEMKKEPKAISAYVSAYDKGKLVSEIRKQTLVPVYIHNRPLLQKAINVQAAIMMDEDNSAFVRSTAAKHLMDALKEPQETAQLNIAINNENSAGFSAINELTDALNKLTDKQVGAVIDGEYTTKEIAALGVADNIED